MLELVASINLQQIAAFSSPFLVDCTASEDFYGSYKVSHSVSNALTVASIGLYFRKRRQLRFHS